MIKLKSDLVSIEVDPSNPLYSVLAKFVGEVFFVQSTEEKKEEKPVREAPKKKNTISHPTEGVSVNIAEYLFELDKLFPDEKSVTKSILKQHAVRFFGVSEGVKTGNYAAISPFSSDQYVTCVRMLDDTPAYLTVPMKWITTL
jgi:hypothetical protein